LKFNFIYRGLGGAGGGGRIFRKIDNLDFRRVP
jgi:hypothetical protein